MGACDAGSPHRDGFSLRFPSLWREPGGRYCRSAELCVQCEALDFCGSDIQESENIASLHNQITACDAVLEVGGLHRCHTSDLSAFCSSFLFFVSIFFFVPLGQVKISHPPGLLDTGVFAQRLGWHTCPHSSSTGSQAHNVSCPPHSAWSRCWELFRATSAPSALRSGPCRSSQGP